MPCPDYKRPSVTILEYWFNDRNVAYESRDRLVFQQLHSSGFLDYVWERDHDDAVGMPKEEVAKVAADPVAYWHENMDTFMENMSEKGYLDVDVVIEVEEFQPTITNTPVAAHWVSAAHEEIIKKRYERRRSARIASSTLTTPQQHAK